MANDFYQNSSGATGVSAFTPASDVCTAPVAGDNYLPANGKCVLTWSDAVNPNTSFFPGYSNFKGFTQGPGLLGKDLLHLASAARATTGESCILLTNGSRR